MITIVCGPSGAGKTTYVREHMKPGDLVIDLDYLYYALSLQPQHEHLETVTPYVRLVYDALVVRLETEQRKGNDPAAWIIAGLPDAQRRRELADDLSATVVMLDIPYDECMRRIAQDAERSTQGREYWHPIVSKWWDVYKRRG